MNVISRGMYVEVLVDCCFFYIGVAWQSETKETSCGKVVS